MLPTGARQPWSPGAGAGTRGCGAQVAFLTCQQGIFLLLYVILIFFASFINFAFLFLSRKVLACRLR